MKRTITINGVDYTNNLVDGYVNTFTYTEELNTGTISLFNVPKLSLESYDRVIIGYENGDKSYFLINTWSEEIVNYKEQLYRYNIELISETKILEGIILPSLAITKPSSGSTKKVYDYISFIQNYYIEKYSQHDENYKFYDEISLASTLQDNCHNANCPEITWSVPNAKLVLNDLLSTIPNHPSLVTMNNFKIDCIDLSKKGKAIDKTKCIVNSTNYQRMADYTNNLIAPLNNVIPGRTNINYKQIPSTLRENDKAVLQLDSDLKLELINAQIETISSLKVKATIGLKCIDKSNNTVYKSFDFWLDIRSYVLPKEQYDCTTVGDETLTSNSRLMNLYYELDRNYIGGLGYEEKTLLGSSTYPALYYVLQQAYLTQFGNNYNPDSNLYSSATYDKVVLDDISTMIFIAQVRSAGSLIQRFTKAIPTKHNISMVDNQNQPFVDMLSLSQVEREKVNRLGNDIKIINATYTNYEDIPDLLDYDGDYILAKKEVAFYNNLAICNLILSKNYIQKNTYYGLQSRERFTRLATDNTIIRNENIYTKVKFSLDSNDENNNSIAIYFASYFSKGTLKNVDTKYGTGISPTLAVIRTFSGTTGQIINTGYLQPLIWESYKSTTVSLQAYDNYSLGMSVTKKKGKNIQEYVPYVDSNGEYSVSNIELMRGYNSSFINGLDENATTEQKEYVKVASSLYPQYKSTYKIASNTIAYLDGNSYKDNREVIKFDYQYDFVNGEKDNSELILSEEIGWLNSLMDENHKLKLYISTTEVYNEFIDGETQPLGTEWPGGTEENRNGLENATISLPSNAISTLGTSIKSWCLAVYGGEGHDHIVFAVNKGDTGLKSVVYVKCE